MRSQVGCRWVDGAGVGAVPGTDSVLTVVGLVIVRNRSSEIFRPAHRSEGVLCGNTASNEGVSSLIRGYLWLLFESEHSTLRILMMFRMQTQRSPHASPS